MRRLKEEKKKEGKKKKPRTPKGAAKPQPHGKMKAVPGKGYSEVNMNIPVMIPKNNFLPKFVFLTATVEYLAYGRNHTTGEDFGRSFSIAPVGTFAISREIKAIGERHFFASYWKTTRPRHGRHEPRGLKRSAHTEAFALWSEQHWIRG